MEVDKGRYRHATYLDRTVCLVGNNDLIVRKGRIQSNHQGAAEKTVARARGTGLSDVEQAISE